MPRTLSTVARKLLAQVVEVSADAIFSEDLSGRITSWNPAAEALYGCLASDMIGRSAAELLPETTAAHLTHVRAQALSGERVARFDTWHQRVDGRHLAVSVSATSIAESVETPEQYAALRSLGCQQAQRFLWSRAVPAAELQAALARADLVPTPAVLPVPRSRRRAPVPRLEPEVEQRIALLHQAGASLHTIAAALNRDGATNPAGVRWHAHAVARHVPHATVERLAKR